MECYDEKLLDSRRKLEHEKYTTLKTGIYVDDELITFSAYTLPNTSIHVFLPVSFVIMPKKVKEIKYPNRNSPDFIYTNVAGTVNLGFNLLPEVLEEGGTQVMSHQFQKGLSNLNPSIRIENQKNGKTIQGKEMSWFDFKGFSLDGQNFNRIYLICLRKVVLQGIFNCQVEDKEKWQAIVEQIFLAVEEDI